MEQTIEQIMQLISSLPPEGLEALMGQLEQLGGAQEPQGTVAPEAGPQGVPVKM